MEPFSPDTRHAILRNPTGSRFLAQDQRATHTPTAPVSSAPNQPAPPPTSSVYHSARAGSSPPPVPSLSPPGWSSSPDSSWTNVSPSPSGAPNLHQHTNLGDRVMDYPMELRDLSLLSSAPIVREVFELQHLRESASAAATSAAERAEYWFAQANALRREAAEVDNHATCLRAQADHDRTMFFRQRAAPAAHQAHVFGQSDDSSSEATDASDGAASSASERSSIFDQAPHVPEISALPTGLVSDRRANDPFAHEMSRYAERLRESDVWHARASRMFHEVDDLTRRAFEAREAATIMRQQVHEIEGVLRAHLQMLGVPIAVATGRTHGQGVPAAVATGRSHGQGVLDMAPRSNEWLRNNVPPAPRPAFAQLAHVPAPPAHNTSRGVNSGHAHPAAAPSGIPTMTSPIPHGPGYGHTQIRGDASAFYPQYQGTTMAMHGGPVAPPGNRGSFYNVGHPLAAVQNPSTANSAYAAYGYNARVTTAHPRRQAAASEMPGSPMGLLGHAYPAHQRHARRSVRPPPLSPPGSPRAEADFWVEMRCAICREQVADTAILPCGHCSICRWCFSTHVNGREDWSELCPFCRQRIVSSGRPRRIFFVTSDRKACTKAMPVSGGHFGNVQPFATVSNSMEKMAIEPRSRLYLHLLFQRGLREDIQGRNKAIIGSGSMEPIARAGLFESP